MATTTTPINARTAAAFATPEKFTAFCANGGQPLGGIIGGKQISGSMNATFQTTDPGSQEVLATVSEMGEAEVGHAVDAATQAFHGNGGQGWRDVAVEERIAMVNRLVELCERDQDVLLACEIRDGGKVSELAEGDLTQIRACAEYFCDVARKIPMGDGPATQISDEMTGATYREPWGVVAGIIPWN